VSPLAVCSAASALGAAVVAARWWTRRRDALGRARPFPYVSVVLLVVLAVAAAVPVVRTRQQESQLSKVASQLAGRTVTVDCQSTTGALVDTGVELGFVPFDAEGRPLPRTTLKRDPCARLRAYADGGQGRPSTDEVIAVHVLTHEAMHMRGEPSEAATECQALQRNAQAAQLLGATPSQAAELSRRYWEDVYPRMPADYRSADCRPGGAWDEGLESSPWR